MTLRVEAGDLEGFAAMCARNSGYAEQVQQHVRSYAAFASSDQGLIGRLGNMPQTLADEMAGRMGSIVGALDASTTELTASARWYRTTDAVQAKDLDATYPQPQR